MRQHEFEKQFQVYLEMMKTTMLAKNADYTGHEDPFANLTLSEKFGVNSAEQAFFTRMCDKFCRVSTFIKKGTLQVKAESVEDTLLDLANYAVLLACYLKGKRDEESPNTGGVEAAPPTQKPGVVRKSGKR